MNVEDIRMPRTLLVFQSLWAMERRQPDGSELSLNEKLEKIVDAGFDGVSADWSNRLQARQIMSVLKLRGLAKAKGFFTFRMIAYNLIRIPKLLAAAA